MKILYVITQAELGGAQKYVLSLAKHFGGTIASGSDSEELFEQAKKIGVPTYKLHNLKRDIHPINDLLAAWEIRKLIEIIKPDIVHLNSSKAGILGSLASFGLSAKGGSASGGKTKVIFTAHGFVFLEPMPMWKKNFYLALEKTASSFRDFIITVSEIDKQSALKHKLIVENKIQTVHNGLKQINFLEKNEAMDVLKTRSGELKNIQAFSALQIKPPLPNPPPQEEGNKLTGTKTIIGCVANFYKTKGLDVLLDAVSLLSENLKNQIQVILIGSGEEEKNLRFKIEDLRLTKIFKFTGNIPNASEYLKAFDIFVLPSRKEGFPYAILEAMQAGLPIVATNVGGIPEALGDVGILVKPENPKELSQALENLVLNKKFAISLGEKAKARSQLFSEEKMLSETKAIYEKVLS